MNSRRVRYLVSFALPRFCDQSLDRSRKERFYPGAEPWMAKLDTVVHELYHIDPEMTGIRRIEREDGTYFANSHGHRFFAQVAEMVQVYLDSRPDPAVSDFLRHDFSALETMHGGISGTSFRTFPSFPAALHRTPARADAVRKRRRRREGRTTARAAAATTYSDADLDVRQFLKKVSRRVARRGQFRAA